MERKSSFILRTHIYVNNVGHIWYSIFIDSVAIFHMNVAMYGNDGTMQLPKEKKNGTRMAETKRNMCCLWVHDGARIWICESVNDSKNSILQCRIFTVLNR